MTLQSLLLDLEKTQKNSVSDISKRNRITQAFQQKASRGKKTFEKWQNISMVLLSSILRKIKKKYTLLKVKIFESQ